MPYFNDILAGQCFLAGDTSSMADITLFAVLAIAEIIGLPIAPGLNALAAWRSNVTQLPAVKNRSGQAPLPEVLAGVGI